MIAAEVMSALGVDVDPGWSRRFHFWRAGKPSSRRGKGSCAREPVAARRRRAACKRVRTPLVSDLPTFLAPLLEHLDSIDAVELDARLRRALRIEQRLSPR